MGLINEYFSKGFGCCLFSFLCTPSRAEMRVMPRSELPSMLFHHCPASLADSSLTHGNTLIMAFGWQAGILLFLQKLICPVDSASRIRISEYSPNDHTSNSENISSSSQLLRSKSTVSAYFSGVGIYVPKMPFRIGRLWRLRMKGLGLSSPPVRKDIVVLLFASAPHLTTCSYAEGWEMGSAIGASAPEYVRNSQSDVEITPACILRERHKFSLEKNCRKCNFCCLV